MSNILKQRHFLTKRDFEITDSGLKITVTKPFNYFEREFSFENIEKKTVKRKVPNKFVLILFSISLIGFLITFIGKLSGDNTIGWDDVSFYIVLLGISTTLFWITFINQIHLMLSDGVGIAFIANKPNKNEVNNYIALFFLKQKETLLEKYGQVDEYLSADQLLINFKWLKGKGIIDDKEFNELSSKINRPKPSSPIGFKFYSSDN